MWQRKEEKTTKKAGNGRQVEGDLNRVENMLRLLQKK